MSEDLKSKIFKEKELTYKEKRRQKAKEKRQKDQMSVTIFGLIVYSIALIGVVVLSYVGFKSVINNLKEKQAVVSEESNYNCLKKSLPLSSTSMKAGKSSTRIFQIASIPSSGYSTHSMLLILFWARMAAGPPMEPR